LWGNVMQLDTIQAVSFAIASAFALYFVIAFVRWFFR